MKTYIYFHICCLNNWKEIVDKIIFKIKDSGLYDIVDEIRCGILGNYEKYESLKNDPKIKIIGNSPDIKLYECFTLNMLYNDALRSNEEFNVLYLHSKGLNHNKTNPNVEDWVEYLCYFNIYKYAINIKKLSDFDTVSVNLNYDKTIHYSGNFWWSKSSYIKKLKICTYECYNSPEYWITSCPEIGNYLCLWKSNVEHYTEPYKPDKYILN